MQTRTNAAIWALGPLLVLPLHQAIAADAALTERPQLLIYTLTTDSETVNPLVPGLIAEAFAKLTVEAYRKSHEKFLSVLQSISSDGTERTSLLRPLACIGIATPNDNCRRIAEAKDGVAQNKLMPFLQGEPTRSAQVAEIKIIFDGRFFQVPTKLYEVRLNDKNEVVVTHNIIVTYITTYSRKQHQEDIATHRNDTPFAGSIGSKEARMHYWFGGTNSRIMAELDRSIAQIADLRAATLSPDAIGVFAGDDSVRHSLPRVENIVAKDSEKCKTMHPKLLVAKDRGDYLWLVFGANLRNANQFFVEPRCGFDY